MFTQIYLAWLRFRQRAFELQQGALSRAVLEIASGEIGEGETESDNRGEAITRYRGGVDSSGAWCAAFVGWCIEQACEKLGAGCVIPQPRTFGAKKLFRQIAKVGKVIPLNKLRPGDIVCLHRGKELWMGHIVIVRGVHTPLVHTVRTSGVVTTIEGNVGAFPAKVRTLRRDLAHERVLGAVRLPVVSSPIPTQEDRPSQGP